MTRFTDLAQQVTEKLSLAEEERGSFAAQSRDCIRTLAELEKAGSLAGDTHAMFYLAKAASLLHIAEIEPYAFETCVPARQLIEAQITLICPALTEQLTVKRERAAATT